MEDTAVLSNVNLNQLANIVILVSAVIIAVKNIYAFLRKPVDDYQDRANEAEEKHIETVLKREMPTLMEKNCSVIIGAIDELKEMSIDQEGQLTQIQESIDLLSQSQLDIMRYNMNKIYYKYREYKKILSADKKAFIKIYNDYKTMHGNTWIDQLYAELKDWPIVEEEQELHW